MFWHPAGGRVRHVMEAFWKEVHLARGYDMVYSPHVAKLDLWKTSGHFDFYKDSMFDAIEIEEEQYQLKPMNCPGHVLMYRDGYYSYRDLPLRWAELGTVYRYERSGTMHGLFRVRGFTQDDAHVFCLPEQIAGEIRSVLDLIEELLTTFGFADYEINLSTRPAKSIGSDEIWEKSEAALKEALAAKGWAFVVDEGGGAFYGPKIDLKIKDAIGRKWQCSTIQVDFNLPERFGLEYTDKEGGRPRPIMIHRAVLGSIERFFGILVENYAGAFPLWLAPVQLRLLPVSDDFVPYCQEVAAAMRAEGLRVEIMGRNSIAKLIRNAEKAKTPVMAVARSPTHASPGPGPPMRPGQWIDCERLGRGKGGRGRRRSLTLCRGAARRIAAGGGEGGGGAQLERAHVCRRGGALLGEPPTACLPARNRSSLCLTLLSAWTLCRWGRCRWTT